MQTAEYAATIVEELRQAAGQLPAEDAERLVEAVLEAGKVFVAGAGRSGLMAKAFAMRLMHLGIPAYVVGETVTPGLDTGDLLLIASGSGETKSLIAMADKAKALGGTLALATIEPSSSLGQRADIVAQLPGAVKDAASDPNKTIQPMGSLFEQMLLLFLDAVILRLMDKRGQDSGRMYGKHANLE
ncbi:6-phospho 3-hexuloisomerase [Paenibacillus darwinianus]|uniref:6-phospho 3-hexuloisomerase n=1 Tax=Paenibacillus darwinianus TaxID=1380763 RepID=A0A9W5S057_9BACL|nr:6-phospho-3-hexuloisomerase [Paenibacillus darwinianus]EXX85867.1 6-phospho 3-hexuloisomerase [Paenibacillus darwinianus]EXX87850.1 6-phospho 3-hexuloisomerase [Paenibacillus darwinianus]EXX88068.1 6-phospho 3-hexuloisomerase [Paenibacillus darwinianus]